MVRKPVDREAPERELERLPGLPSEELKDLWRGFYGRDPPVRIGRPLMIRAVAYQMQVAAYGGLKESTKRLLRKIAEDARQGKQPDAPAPKPGAGTRLLRTWHGVTHEVVMLEKGRALFEGKEYRSLTAVAEAITGNHWSGPEFFGLNSKRTHRVGP